MAKYTNTAVGNYAPNGGEGLTVRQLIKMLREIPSKARDSYVMADLKDVIGMQVRQSDQAEANELKVYLTLDGE
jgi:hypothetical protein